MKEYNNQNSMYSFQQLKVEINTIKQLFLNGDLAVIDLVVMTEKEVLHLLKISRTTLFKYREQKLIKSYQVFNRNVYLKHEIYEAIINQILK
jgi:hypothetical protein